MAGIIQYVTYQDNRKNVGTGKFYGRAVHTTTINSDTLAERIQSSCTLKISDVKACLVELVEEMKRELQNSNKVHLNGFGTFYINVKSTGAESEDKFTANDNITGFRCRFVPEGHKDIATGKISRTFLDNLKVQKATGFVRA